MAVSFPLMETQLGFWKTVETQKKPVTSELDKFLATPSYCRMSTPEPQKIRVVWPAILSSDCSTWLSTRKAESDKKQTEKENSRENPWLASGAELSATDLATSVREGLLRATTTPTNNTLPNNCRLAEETRVPLPISEDIDDKAEDDVLMVDEPSSLPAMVRMGLLRAGSVSVSPKTQLQDAKKPRPWAPKSLAEEVKIGLLKAGTGLKHETNSQEDLVPVTVGTEEPDLDAGKSLESFADSLRRSFMNISITSQPSTTGESTPSGGLQENSDFIREAYKQESLDAWIMDDNQSEDASIITLDTTNDSDVMDDFDDFKDIEQELTMWISKQ